MMRIMNDTFDSGGMIYKAAGAATTTAVGWDVVLVRICCLQAALLKTLRRGVPQVAATLFARLQVRPFHCS